MNIAVIGTGNIGASLIKYFINAGFSVKMANRSGAGSLKDLEAETGARAVEIQDVSTEADIIVLAIPQTSLRELPKDMLLKAKQNVIILDCTNYFPQWFGKIDDLENGLTESVWVQKEIGHSVIKVFNTILAGSLANSSRSAETQERIALSIFGDSSEEKQIVAKLVDAIGFDPVICGLIEESWKAQPGSPIYCTDLTKDQLLKNYERVDKSILTAKRDANVTSVMALPPSATWKDQVNAIRKNVL